MNSVSDFQSSAPRLTALAVAGGETRTCGRGCDGHTPIAGNGKNGTQQRDLMPGQC